MVRSKIKLVRLLSNDGKILFKNGLLDFSKGIHDEQGKSYPAGFDSKGNAYGESGDPKTGQILFEDGTETGYNINENYFPLVCMRIVHSIHRTKNPNNKKTKKTA